MPGKPIQLESFGATVAGAAIFICPHCGALYGARYVQKRRYTCAGCVEREEVRAPQGEAGRG